MRLVFLGNGPFARPSLAALANTRHPILAVVTRPNRPQGKRREILPGPVETLARESNLPVLQPEDVNSDDFLQQLVELGPELLVVADFGQILSPECLATASHGGINVHGSLLPKYRGAAPVAWAIYHGEWETGVTIIRMTRRLDAGGVLLRESTPIETEETAGSLEERLAHIGARLATLAVDRIEHGSVEVLPQADELATKAPKLTKEHGRILWNRQARQVHDHVRAMIPWPIAHTRWFRPEGEPIRLQVLSVEAIPGSSLGEGLEPGQVADVSENRLVLRVEQGCVAIDRLKPAGKREMDAASFLRGHAVQVGDRFD